MNPRIVVDAHEDIAYNAIMHGRDFLRSAAETRQREVPPDPMEGSATTGLPDLLRGNVRFVFSTIYVSPASSPFGTGGGSDVKKYRTPEQAYLLAQEQLAYYASLAMDPRVLLVTTRDDVKRVLNADSPQVGLVILMEGADPLITPQHVKEFYEAGVRIIGPAWSQTRYAGGTRAPGPLTEDGRRLLRAMADFQFVLDLSHMDEPAMLEALDIYQGPIVATHGNCLALLPDYQTNRQFSDRVLAGLIERDGVIGLVPRLVHEVQFPGTGVAVVTRLGSGLPLVKGDHVQLQQVLLNLVGNAIRYSSDRSQVWIRLEDENGLPKAPRLLISTEITMTARDIIDAYTLRWTIEPMFCALKHGSGVKETWQRRRQTLHRWVQILSTAFALTQMMAVYDPVRARQLAMVAPWRKKRHPTAGMLKRGLAAMFRNVSLLVVWDRKCRKFSGPIAPHPLDIRDAA